MAEVGLQRGVDRLRGEVGFQQAVVVVLNVAICVVSLVVPKHVRDVREIPSDIRESPDEIVGLLCLSDAAVPIGSARVVVM